MKNFGVIILAAGKGTRLNCSLANKVMLELSGRPMLDYVVSLFERMHLSPIVAVVGFARKGIEEYFKNRVLYVYQKKRLGTAHAASCALLKLPAAIANVLIVNGDDSYLYTASLIQRLIDTHQKTNAAITLLTVVKNNPAGLGRIIRNEHGIIRGIVEEKDATDKERRIKEINPQCWIFKTGFLRSVLPKIKKSPVTGEYYLTDAIKLAVANHEIIADVQAGDIPWRGVNTNVELDEAKKILHH